MTWRVALVRGTADGRTLAASDGELALAIAPADAGAFDRAAGQR
jgi:hypothetical protein